MGDNFFGGGQEEYFQPGTFEQAYKNVNLPEYNARSANYLRDKYQVGADPGYQKALLDYLKGGSQEDLMSNLQNLKGLSADQRAGAFEDAYVNPLTGSKLATEQYMSNPLFSKYFGQGGQLDSAMKEERDLAGRGFQLQPEDFEAYGQASGNIARLFGQQEQDLAQSLASRGLASAPSGIAGQGFSGIQGNKMEQLAQAQTNIANLRMQNNLNRLNATRQYLSQLGNMGQEGVQQQYGRNLSGAQQGLHQNELALNASNQQMQNDLGRYNAALNTFKTNKDLEGQSFQSKTQNYNPGLLGAFGSGLMNSAANIGAAPGKFVSSAAGAAGKGTGGGYTGG